MYGHNYRSSRRTTQARRPPPERTLEQFSFTGVRDHPDPSTGNKRKAEQLQNCYPWQSEVGGGVLGRPGFQILEQGFGGRGQRTFTFTQDNGATRVTVLIANGGVKTVNWSTRVVTAHALGGALVLSTTAHIGIVAFAGGVVISDGVHKPIFGLYNSGAGTWTFTEMTNCPPLYGEPVVHYSRLVGIEAADRTKIVWSEVDDPFTGYEAGGYNNAWALTSTDQDPLFVLRATNAALYYWRDASIGSIYGEISTEWKTTGVQDDVSTTVGTRSPWGVVQYEDSFFFPDRECRVHRMVIGGDVTEPPPWLDSEQTLTGLDRNQLDQLVACPWVHGGLVLFAFVRINGSIPEVILTFNGRSGIFSGTWRSSASGFRTLDEAIGADGRAVLVSTNDDGYAFDWGHPSGQLWSDVGMAIEHVVYGSVLGWEIAQNKHFDRVDISLRMYTSLTNLSVSYVTPRGRKDPFSVNSSSGKGTWDVDEWDNFVWAGDVDENRVSLGLDGEGRWIQMRFSHSGLDEQFGLIGWVITYFPLGNVPTAP